jgi:hypothetical protein
MGLSDFLRQALVVQGGSSVRIDRVLDNQWQATVQIGRSTLHVIEVAPDPVDALWNALAPQACRRIGGQEIVLPLAAPDPLEELLG